MADPHRGPPPRIVISPLPDVVLGDMGGVTNIYGQGETRLGLSDYGEKLYAAEEKVLTDAQNLPAYMQRALQIEGTHIKIVADPSKDPAIDPDDTNRPYFDPDKNEIIIPLTYYHASAFPNLNGRIITVTQLNHEGGHAFDRFLGKLYTAHGGPLTTPSDDAMFSAHPMFAAAYEKDLQRIPHQEKWPMGLGHLLPKEKGGKGDPDYNNVDPRSEAFAQVGEYLAKGESWDAFWRVDHPELPEAFRVPDALRKSGTPYSDVFKKTFPNFIEATTKFYKDMERIEKDNPDDAKFKEALEKYMKRMPEDPTAYLATNMFASTQAAKPSAPASP